MHPPTGPSPASAKKPPTTHPRACHCGGTLAPNPLPGGRTRRGVFNVSNPVYLLKTDRQLETMNPTGSWFLFFFFGLPFSSIRRALSDGWLAVPQRQPPGPAAWQTRPFTVRRAMSSQRGTRRSRPTPASRAP
uniref:Uncharacterized protein n=1 Tax=Rousettus aegyptiacus TaxID=9407 RepID=A0A7J8C261_ROUAE|nr:hypothetical protein HJG63_009273 [Rousettus aegyptiacus]